MPRLEEYGVPMVVDLQRRRVANAATPGLPISPPSEMEALGLEKYMKDLGIKQADFLAVNTDWGRGAVGAFGDLLKHSGAQVGSGKFMEQAATDMNAQITKVKAGGADTLFLTTSVGGITLVLKQAQEQRLVRKVVATSGTHRPPSSSSGRARRRRGRPASCSSCRGSRKDPDGELTKAFVDEWAKRGPSRG